MRPPAAAAAAAAAEGMEAVALRGRLLAGEEAKVRPRAGQARRRAVSLVSGGSVRSARMQLCC